MSFNAPPEGFVPERTRRIVSLATTLLLGMGGVASCGLLFPSTVKLTGPVVFSQYGIQEWIPKVEASSGGFELGCVVPNVTEKNVMSHRFLVAVCDFGKMLVPGHLLYVVDPVPEVEGGPSTVLGVVSVKEEFDKRYTPQNIRLTIIAGDLGTIIASGAEFRRLVVVSARSAHTGQQGGGGPSVVNASAVNDPSQRIPEGRWSGYLAAEVGNVRVDTSIDITLKRVPDVRFGTIVGEVRYKSPSAAITCVGPLLFSRIEGAWVDLRSGQERALARVYRVRPRSCAEAA